jgi:hypothetical protein
MKIPAAIVSCTLLFAAPLFARDKTDVLVMSNGDRLRCEIKGLDAGVLYVSFDYIKGTTQVNWAKVRYVESKQLFLVKTEDGSAYTGTISTAETEGARPVQIEVLEDTGQKIVVEQQQVVDMYQTSDSFWRRFNGDINSGLTYSKANQSTQYTFSAEVQYPRERWAAGAAYTSTLSANSGSTTSTRNDGALYYRRLMRWNNWFYTGLAYFLQSSEQEIDVQSNLGGAIGRYLKNTNRTTIIAFGGLAWQNTRYSQTASVPQFSQSTAAGLFGGNVELFKFNKTNLTLTGAVFPSISQSGRVYTNVNATYYLKFYNDFTWNFSFYGNWDTQPPHNFSGSNYGLSSGLGWTFGNK